VKEGSIKRDIVTPGETLAVIEEFFPGENTLEKKGEIRSLIVGLIQADFNRRVISVRKARKNRPLLPEPGDVIYALVQTVKDGVIAINDIIEIENKGVLSVPFTGILHVSESSSSYVKSLYEILRPGDFIRAVVVGRMKGPPYRLSIKGRDFGVILARCNFCLRYLRLKGGQLYCGRCKTTLRRKISLYYLFK